MHLNPLSYVHNLLKRENKTLSCSMKLNIYPNLIPGALREEVKAKSGDTVSLPCIINREECGDFHSIKWYKENRRVYVYSPIAEFTKAEGELLDRYVMVHLYFYSS